MRTKILALFLFVGTAAAVAFYPHQPNPHIPAPVDTATPLNHDRHQIEIVFVLDTTGSMSGLIQTAKEKIWSIASTMASAQQRPQIKIGLVAYRDRGDAYVTQTVDLSRDLDGVYAKLMDFNADGGGDVPESVNQALHEAVHNMSWSSNTETYRAIFLVGDAPPQMRYQDEVKYPQTMADAKQKGIYVNTILCGDHRETLQSWQHIAALGQGDFLQVAQHGNAVAIDTPFDAEIARLSATLDDTRFYYGSVADKEKNKIRAMNSKKLRDGASVAARARRAEFNLSESGETNFLGDKELLDDVKDGRVLLSDLDNSELPSALQSLSPQEAENFVDETLRERERLTQRIKVLAEKRQRYMEDTLEESGNEGQFLDKKLFDAVRKQAEAKGFSYDAGAAKY